MLGRKETKVGREGWSPSGQGGGWEGACPHAQCLMLMLIQAVVT